MSDLISFYKNSIVSKYFNDKANFEYVSNKYTYPKQVWKMLNLMISEASGSTLHHPMIVLSEDDKKGVYVQFLNNPFDEPIYLPKIEFPKLELKTGYIFYISKEFGNETLGIQDFVNSNAFENICNYYTIYKTMYAQADERLNEAAYQAVAESSRMMLDSFAFNNFSKEFYNSLFPALSENRGGFGYSKTEFLEYTNRLDKVIKKIEQEMSNTDQNIEDFVEKESEKGILL